MQDLVKMELIFKIRFSFVVITLGHIANNQPLTAPKKNAGRSISFLPTSCPYRESHYIYVGKKEAIFQQLINIMWVENISVSKPHFF